MKLLISGHRKYKLEGCYDTGWIRRALFGEMQRLHNDHCVGRAYSGMASGVDLWFCDYCVSLAIPYVACIPFDEQGDTMEPGDKVSRDHLIRLAAETRKVKNSWMVEQADRAIIVWDGNKGGTHNVLQQMVEARKPFSWINPVGQKVWLCV